MPPKTFRWSFVAKIADAMVSHAKVAVADVVAPDVTLAVGGALACAGREALDRHQPGAGWPPAHGAGG